MDIYAYYLIWAMCSSISCAMICVIIRDCHQNQIAMDQLINSRTRRNLIHNTHIMPYQLALERIYAERERQRMERVQIELKNKITSENKDTIIIINPGENITLGKITKK